MPTNAAAPIVRAAPLAGPGWSLDAAALSDVADACRDRYRRADPFPHVVLDGLFPDELLNSVLDAFPSPDDTGWDHIDDGEQRKLQWHDPATIPPAIASCLQLLETGVFLDFLERLTGVSGLIGDPHRHHGGLHQIESGGYLHVHSDQTLQPRLWLYRRVNVIVYLNRDWDDGWGGRLELWDPLMTRAVEAVAPRFNRTVILDTTPPANHGHPDPLATPPGVTRRSLALYYYTASDNPSTPRRRTIGNYRARPGERVRAQRWELFKGFVHDVLPPGIRQRAVDLKHRAQHRP